VGGGRDGHAGGPEDLAVLGRDDHQGADVVVAADQVEVAVDLPGLGDDQAVSTWSTSASSRASTLVANAGRLCTHRFLLERGLGAPNCS
jgi:hypothetical protein